MKSSPRRRKVLNARKGVSFTPVKKKTPTKRVVRWRDDETEEGTLADFEKTPQKPALTLDPVNIGISDTAPTLPPLPTYLEVPEETSDSSPSLVVPEPSTLSLAKPNRFQAGFLSKSRGSDGSPAPTAPTLSLNLAGSSDSEDKPTPLRPLDVSRSGNYLSPTLKGSVRSPKPPVTTSLDENNPPSAIPLSATASASNSDSETSTVIDPNKLRSALHSAKRRDRLSSLSSTAASNAKRISSISSQSSVPFQPHHRVSNSYSGPLASSTNGISRQRRLSGDRNDRRRSPPITCSPPGESRAFTPGQARRMNLGGSVRCDSSSPQKERVDSKTRRITIGSAAMAGAGPTRPAQRASVVWR